MDEATSDATSYRLRRGGDGPGLGARIRGLMARRRWRWLAYAFGALISFLFLFWLLFARGLPDAKSLLDYQPPLPTVVSKDGQDTVNLTDKDTELWRFSRRFDAMRAGAPNPRETSDFLQRLAREMERP